MNERGLRVRFIHRSELALSTQQDRSRKCSLTIVAARKALTRSMHQTGQHGFYPVNADTSKKADHGHREVLCLSEESSAKSSSARRLG